MVKIGNKNGDVTKLYRHKKYYKRLMNSCTQEKWDNLDERDIFLKTQNLLKLNYEEIENLNRPITSKIESVI